MAGRNCCAIATTRTWRSAPANARSRAPGGALEALRVERVRENPGRTTTSWLAPALGWLPVRIVQREADGETIEMRLLAD